MIQRCIVVFISETVLVEIREVNFILCQSLSEKLPIRSFLLEGGQSFEKVLFCIFEKAKRPDWRTQSWQTPTISPKHLSTSSWNLPIRLQYIRESENTDIQNKKNLFNKI